MLTLSQYGVTLKRVTEHDIEEIRYWRNQPFIRNTMQFRKHITKKMQQESKNEDDHEGTLRRRA